jgi:hypothetical protein
MGFFKDLFAKPRPCDLCRFTANSWPSDRTAVAKWSTRGAGLNVDFSICGHCFAVIRRTGLGHKNPVLVMGYLISHGFADRPPAHAYLQHEGWRRVWMHTLEILQTPAADEFKALAAIKAYEQGILDGFDDM